MKLKPLCRIVGTASLITCTFYVASPAKASPEGTFVVTRIVDGKPIFTTVDSTTAEKLRRQGEIVTSNLRVKVSSVPSVGGEEESEVSNDEEFVSPRGTWMLKVATAATPAVVAVIDTGVDPTHPILKESLVNGSNFVPHDGLSAVEWADGNGHGTHVAGIVAYNNPFAKIMPVRVLDREGEGEVGPMARGIVWAVDNGAQVLNLSFGIGVDAGEDLLPLRTAVSYAVSRGVIVVAAAGNEGEYGSPTSAPAVFDDVIAVAATDGSVVAPFSNRGKYIDIATEGVEIRSTALGGGDVRMSGTSMASPKVAAAAAAVLMANPTWTASDVRDQLLATATDEGVQGPDPVYGYGSLNIRKAVLFELTRPAGQMHTLTKTRIKVKALVGGVNVTSKFAWTFIQRENGDIESVTNKEPFILVTSAEKVLVWSYDEYGAPTEPVAMTLRGIKLPALKASVKRSGRNVSLVLGTKLPASTLLTVSTISKTKKVQEVAVLYASVGRITVPAAGLRGFRVCYAVYDIELGCKSFKL